MVENSKIGRIIFLGFGAAQDIKYQKISTEYLLAGSCAAILYRALFGRMHWSVWVAGLGCGIVFHDIEMVTGGNRVRRQLDDLEYGYFSWDLESAWNADACIFVAAMAAGAGLWSGKWKRTTRMSFYPFLLIGYLGTFIW